MDRVRRAEPSAGIALPAWALGWLILFVAGILVADKNEDNPLHQSSVGAPDTPVSHLT